MQSKPATTPTEDADNIESDNGNGSGDGTNGNGGDNDDDATTHTAMQERTEQHGGGPPKGNSRPNDRGGLAAGPTIPKLVDKLEEVTEDQKDDNVI